MNRNRRICIGGQTSRKSGMKSRKSERDGINRGIPESGSRAKILGLGRKNVLGVGVTLSPNCFLEQLRAESSWKTSKFPDEPLSNSLKHMRPTSPLGFCASAPQHASCLGLFVSWCPCFLSGLPSCPSHGWPHHPHRPRHLPRKGRRSHLLSQHPAPNRGAGPRKAAVLPPSPGGQS